jgi:hypothetical protein
VAQRFRSLNLIFMSSLQRCVVTPNVLRKQRFILIKRFAAPHFYKPELAMFSGTTYIIV